jgi:flagellar hook-associated protein 2
LENDFSGKQTFDLEVATPSDSSNDRKSVRVELSSSDFSGTNEEVLSNVQSAVDSALQSAVDNGKIASDERPTVSVINPTSDTARLSVRSAETGYDGRLAFSNTGTNDGLLSNLQVQRSDGAVGENADGEDGGYITKVGDTESGSELTSEFTLDGLTLTRNSNKVDEALEGVTIDLEEKNGTESSFEVTADEEGAKSVVKDFVDRVNEVITFLKKETDLAPNEDEERGTLADDSTFRRLERQLRTDATAPVDGQPDGLNTLADIGIEANRDGTLKLADEEALKTAVRENESAVKDLFASSDGVATRLESRVDLFADSGGVIDDQTDSIDNSIDRIDDRIDQFDERLERREQQLRDRFANVQSTIRSLASQQQIIGSRL